jgi:hydroxyacylglutathione hydrolase
VASKTLRIQILPLLSDNFSYVLHDSHSTLATIIDPSESSPVRKFLAKEALNLELIICTHHHLDHVGGAQELADQKVPIWASDYDRSRIAGCTRGLSDSEEVLVAGHKMRVIFVPGHTLGQIALYFEEASALFVGDTLFSLGCGRLFEGTADQMIASLNKLMALPDETKIYFGHEYTLRNGEFVESLNLNLPELKTYLQHVRDLRSKGNFSTPSLLDLEKRLNPFLNAHSVEEWTRRRALRNHF